MNELDITCFLSVARTGSYELTMEELSITPYILEAKIQRLEEELGCELFYKNYHKIRLTVAGRYYYDFFSNLERKLGIAESILGKDGNDPVKICISTSPGITRCMGNKLHKINKNMGEQVDYAVISEEEVRELVSGSEADILLTTRFFTKRLPIVSPVEFLWEEPMYIIYKDKIDEDDMEIYKKIQKERFPYLTGLPEGFTEESMSEHIYLECAKLGFRPNNIHFLPNMDTVGINIAYGNGFTLAPKLCFSKKSNVFRYISTKRSISVMAVLPRGNKSPKIQKVLEYLREEEI